MYLNLLSAKENKQAQKWQDRQKIKEMKRSGIQFGNQVQYDSRVKTHEFYARSRGQWQ